MAKPKKKYVELNPEFYGFANQISKILSENNAKVSPEEAVELQKNQLESLMKAEEVFRKSIIKLSQGEQVYQSFILKIVAEQKNILDARPFFREDAKTFSKSITPTFRNADIKSLQKFRINYKFISFVEEVWKGPLPAKAQKALKDILLYRRLVIENSLPLAVNEAKKFFHATSESNNKVSLMELIFSAIEGLISGVDKYHGKSYSRVFRSVCIGRMKGNLISVYSETDLHFFPREKRILYKANIIRKRSGITDLNKLTEAINASFLEDIKTDSAIIKVDSAELLDIMSAASTYSIDSEAQTNETGQRVTLLDSYIDENENIQDDLSNKDILDKIKKIASTEDLILRKILIMKGLDV